MPFGNRALLPACAAACGHLYDANGACVPPAIPTNSPAVYTSCFCFDSRLAPFSTTTAGVCDQACTAEPNGLASITNWYHSVCNIKNVAAPSSTSTISSSSGIPSGSGIPQRTDAPSGDWYAISQSHQSQFSSLHVDTNFPMQDLHSLPMGHHARHPRRRHRWHLDRRLHLAPPLHPQARSSSTSRRRQHRLLGLRRPALGGRSRHPHDLPGQDQRDSRTAQLYGNLGEAQHDDQAVALFPVMRETRNKENMKKREGKREREKER